MKSTEQSISRLSPGFLGSPFSLGQTGITIPNPHPLSPPLAQNARVTGQQISFPKFTTILDGFFRKGGLVRFRISRPTACFFTKVRSRLDGFIASPISGAGGSTTISWR